MPLQINDTSNLNETTQNISHYLDDVLQVVNETLAQTDEQAEHANLLFYQMMHLLYKYHIDSQEDKSSKHIFNLDISIFEKQLTTNALSFHVVPSRIHLHEDNLANALRIIEKFKADGLILSYHVTNEPTNFFEQDTLFNNMLQDYIGVLSTANHNFIEILDIPKLIKVISDKTIMTEILTAPSSNTKLNDYPLTQDVLLTSLKSGLYMNFYVTQLNSEAVVSAIQNVIKPSLDSFSKYHDISPDSVSEFIQKQN